MSMLQDCAAATGRKSASPRRSPNRARAPPASADQHLLRNPWRAQSCSTTAAGSVGSAAGALHAKKCLFSSPPSAGAHQQHMYSSGNTGNGSAGSAKQYGSYSPGAWLKSRAEPKSPLKAVLERSSSASSSQQQGTGAGQQQRRHKVGLRGESDAGDDCRSSVDDGVSSSASSSMAASQVEAWQQALSNTLGRALSKLQPVP